MSKVTITRSGGKPAKPHPDFPLFPHATGRWAKKIRGKFHYFGPWSDPDGALRKYLDQKDDLHAGRTPRLAGAGLTVRGLLDHFLAAKGAMVDAGRLGPRSLADYRATCRRIAEAFGPTRPLRDLADDDFERLRAGMAKKWGPVTIGNEIQRVRVLFKHAYNAELIDRPIRYGPTFKRPGRKVLRRAQDARGPRMFAAGQLRAMLDAAGPQLKAMMLLGVNCGFGNRDCGTLPLGRLDLQGGWHAFERGKTGTGRRCPLWPETVAALKAAIAARPKPKDKANAKLAFITKYGERWVKDTSDNPISKECAKLLKRLGIHRRGLNFYALRRTFETVGLRTGDRVAVDHIMGYVRHDTVPAHQEQIGDERLRAVTDHVRKWLFGEEPSRRIIT